MRVFATRKKIADHDGRAIHPPGGAGCGQVLVQPDDFLDDAILACGRDLDLLPHVVRPVMDHRPPDNAQAPVQGVQGQFYLASGDPRGQSCGLGIGDDLADAWFSFHDQGRGRISLRSGEDNLKDLAAERQASRPRRNPTLPGRDGRLVADHGRPETLRRDRPRRRDRRSPQGNVLASPVDAPPPDRAPGSQRPARTLPRGSPGRSAKPRLPGTRPGRSQSPGLDDS